MKPSLLWPSTAVLGFLVLAAIGCNTGRLTTGMMTNPQTVARQATVGGSVRDIATGVPIAGATVSAAGMTTKTNSHGVYQIKVPAGVVTLTAAAGAYLTTTQKTSAPSAALTKLDWHLTKGYGTQAIPAASMAYTILAWNDLGMHCDQDDYSYFAILPPANNLYAQVFRLNSSENGMANNIVVTYEFPKKMNPASQTNFWQFSDKFGWGNKPNVGLTGNGPAGTMKLAADGVTYVATAIPVSPYDDDGTWDPFGTALITVKDLSGNVLQTANVVAPVSTEIACANCHGAVNPQADILAKHDFLNGTNLVSDQAAGTPHACAECHADNALKMPGKPGVESLSLAMHNSHKDKMGLSPLKPDCYNCHPGTRTQCLRGIMARAGKTCVDCHGDMIKMTLGLQRGRRPWLDEPKCGTCHGSAYAENNNTLYRNSVLKNAPEDNMNGRIYCEACHNGTHAEYTTRNSADAEITRKFQGDSYWIWACSVCHPAGRNGDLIHAGAGAGAAGVSD
jgi:hypothetical protein